MSKTTTVETNNGVVKTVDKHITFDLKSWTCMQDFWTYQDLANGNDRKAFLEYVAPLVKSWDYPFDPQDIGSYGRLNFVQWQSFIDQLKECVQGLFQS